MNRPTAGADRMQRVARADRVRAPGRPLAEAVIDRQALREIGIDLGALGACLTLAADRLLGIGLMGLF